MKASLFKTVLLAVIGCLYPANLMAWEANRLWVDKAFLPVGGSTIVNVNIENSSPLEGFQLDFSLPDGMDVSINNKGKLDISLATERVEGSSISLTSRYISSKNLYRVVAVSMTGDVFNDTQSCILNINVQNQEMAIGDYSINFSGIELTENNEPVKLEPVTSDIKVFQPAKSVTINPTELSLYLTTQCALPEYTIEPAEAAECTSIKWWTPTPEIIEVTDNSIKGLQVTESPAQLVLTATNIYNEWANEAICQVTVKPIVESVSIDKTECLLNPGETTKLTATVLPSTVEDAQVIWKSSDETVATVAGGEVKAIAPGVAEITASAWRIGEEYVTSAPCKVTVKAQQTISFTLNQQYYVGESIELEATASSGLPVAYEVTEGHDLVAIDDTKVTCKAPGTVTIIATQGGNDSWMPATAVAQTFTIKPIVESVSIDKTECLLSPGETTELTATILPISGMNLPVIWKSSNENVATVSDGKVSAIAPGVAEITASVWRIADEYVTSEPCKVTVKAKQIISFTLNQQYYVSESIELAAKASSGLPVAYEVTEGQDLIAIEGTKVTFTAPGTVTIIATQEGNDTWMPATAVAQTFTIKSIVESISLNKTEWLLSPGETTELTAILLPSTVEEVQLIWESSNDRVATVVDGEVTAIAPGVAEITASAWRIGEEYLTSAPCKVIVKAEQTISFSLNPQYYVGESIELEATASSGLPVAYKVEAGQDLVTIDGSKVTFIAAGTVTIIANQAGNDVWKAAPSVVQTTKIEQLGSINAINAGQCQIKVLGNNIIVDNCNKELIEVYDILGSLIYCGYESSINLRSNGIYIVKIGSIAKKVKI